MFSFLRKKRACDWCGDKFAGAGQQVGEMAFCSPECAAAHGAPAVEASAGPRVLGAALVESELMIASAEIEHYKKVLGDMDTAGSPEVIEDRASAARATYLGIWEHLDLVRTFVAERGGDVSAYDAVRAQSLTHLESYSESTGIGPTGGGFGLVTVGTAHVDPRNIDRAIAGLNAIGAQFNAHRGG